MYCPTGRWPEYPMGIWDEFSEDENTVRIPIEWHEKDANSENCLTICPACGFSVLNYDSLLNLRCPICGYTTTGSFT